MFLKTRSAIFLTCILWTVTQGSDQFSLPPPATGLTFGPTFSPSDTSTTAVPVTTSSTTTSNTTTVSTTTSITPKSTPNPTTTKPTSPTPKPTSPTPKPTSPTPKPTSPSPKPTSPTPKPDDHPVVNNFTAYSGNKTICFLVKLAILVEVNSTKIAVPKTESYSSVCKEPNFEWLTVNWDKNNSVSFEFFKNESKYEINSINTTVLLPGSNTTTTYFHVKPEFSVSDAMSYYCSRDQPLNLTDINNVTVAKIHISEMQYQAFMNTTENKYGSVWDCAGVNTPDVVPVVVGCILAILVVLVLVAYLFGRRRCQARGYLSIFHSFGPVAGGMARNQSVAAVTITVSREQREWFRKMCSESSDLR